MRTATRALAAAALAAAALPATAAAGLPRGDEHVVLDPAHFSTRITNPWWPMRPGSRWVYRETDADGGRQRDVVTVTHRTRQIANGVTARVVRDVATEDGELVESTEDFYAQDRRGNVWYLGEVTAEYENGRVVSREGSFEAGVGGAEAGVIMPAHPRPGLRYRQEYFKGHAEDHFKIESIRGNRLVTHEWTPIEPGVLDQKVYVRGVGTTSEDSLKGGSEHLHLVEMRRS